MRQRGFAVVRAHLHEDCSLPVRYACVRVIAALSQYPVYATLTLSKCLPLVTSLIGINNDFAVIFFYSVHVLRKNVMIYNFYLLMNGSYVSIAFNSTD